jgi:hypothetical protein
VAKQILDHMERVFHLGTDARLAVLNALLDLLLRAIFHFLDGAAPCSYPQRRERVAILSKTFAQTRVPGIGINRLFVVT